MEDLRDMVVLYWSVQFDITSYVTCSEPLSGAAWTEDTDSYLSSSFNRFDRVIAQGTVLFETSPIFPPAIYSCLVFDPPPISSKTFVAYM